MISELLDLTRTRLGEGIRVSRVRMDLVPVCEHVLAELRAIHPDSELRFVRAGDVTGEWDSDRLTQLLSNLVGNALQHGEKTAPVTLFIEAEGDRVVARVHNQGASIPESDIQSIFEPMSRRPTLGGDRNTSGLGLGLFIAREIAIAHGGGVSVISTPALGTTFRVELPRLAPAPHASASGSRAPRPVDEGS